MDKILVPDYFESFHCKCGECRHPCCDGWGISVDEKEYFSLIGLSCSKKLRRKLDDAFVLREYPSSDCYAEIEPNYVGMCPMLDEDGLCLLQKERGEGLLPIVCRLYPRSVKNYGGHHEISMSNSCEKTVELLLSGNAPLSLHEYSGSLLFDGLKIYEENAEKDEIRIRCVRIMSNGSLPIRERFAAIMRLVCKEEPGGLSDEGSALSGLLHFLEILCIRSESVRMYGEGTLAYFGGARGGEALALYKTAKEHFDIAFPDVERYLGRVLANHLLYESFPYIPDCGDVDTAFAAFLAASALLKVLCVCGTAHSKNIADLVDILSYTNRFLEHSDYYKTCAMLEHPKGSEVYARFSSVF